MYKFLLCQRYLRTRFIALASIISVMLGVATMIVVNSVMTGFSTQMKDRIHGILADVVVESTSTDGAPDPGKLMAMIEKVAGDDIAAMTPTVEIYGILSFDWLDQPIPRPVTLIGIDPAGKDQVSPLREFLTSRNALIEEGKVVREPLFPKDAPLDWSLSKQAQEYRAELVRWNQLQRSPQHEADDSYVGDGATQERREVAAEATGASLPDDPFDSAPVVQQVDPLEPARARVYIGAGLVSFPHIDEETGQTRFLRMVHPGQDVTISTIKAGVPDTISFKATVVDLFKSGMSEYDSNLVFCNLEELQAVRGMLARPPGAPLEWQNGSVTAIQLKLEDGTNAADVVLRLKTMLRNADMDGLLQVSTWEEKQGPLLEAVAIESAILNVLLFLIIAVAGFGILAIFYMIVVEKTRDIGILKALGANSQGVMSIFLSYGLALGVVGSGIGVALGLLFVRYINEIEDAITWLTGRKVFDESIYYFHEIPTKVHPMMVVSVAVGAMVIAVLASVLPARRASRLHPVEALRYE